MHARTCYVPRNALREPMAEPTYRQPILWIEGHQHAEGGVGDTPSTKQLRERLEHRGVSTLSTAELLSIVLRTGPGTEQRKNGSNSKLRLSGLKMGLKRFARF